MASALWLISFQYLFFCACLLISAIWAFFFLPETKGIPMEEMDRIFGFHPVGHAIRNDERLPKLGDEQQYDSADNTSDRVSGKV